MQNTRAIDLMLLAAGLGVISWISPFEIEGDGAARFRALSRLLGEGGFDRTPYSLYGPLFSAPLWWIGTAFGDAEWWVARYNLFLFAVSLPALGWALRPALDRDSVARFLLILTVASMFPHHLGRYYGEVFSALAVAVGLAVVCVRKAPWGWVVAALGAASTPAMVPGLGVAAAAWAWYTRDARHLLAVAAAAALVLAESWLRRGGFFETGYAGNRGAETVLPFSGRPGFSYPFLLGAVSILLSFGKGILVFAPGLLGIPRRLAGEDDSARRLLAVWTLLLGGLVAVYAKWWSWYGGVFWGPRFFLFASIPAALVMADWLRRRPASGAGLGLAALALLWSCWVGANGLVYRHYGFDVCTADHYALEFLCWYVPEFSTLFGPIYRSPDLPVQALLVLAFFGVTGLWLAVTTTVCPGPREASRRGDRR